MGYSISVRLPTPELRDQVLAFWREDLESNPHPYNLVPVAGEQLAYPPSGNLARVVGFHGSVLGVFPWFACAWLAHKAGTSKNGVWHLYYDDEYIPIQERHARMDLETMNAFVLVDAQGIMDTSRKRWIDRLTQGREYRRMQRTIERWNQAWPAGDAPSPSSTEPPP